MSDNGIAYHDRSILFLSSNFLAAATIALISSPFLYSATVEQIACVSHLFPILKFIGLLDRSTLPLAQRPAVSGECYFDRKCRYSVNAQVICDHRRKILALYTGMPGSCVDITVLKATELWRRINSGEGFTCGQYLLGDSGYFNAPHLISSFKRWDLSALQSDFNLCVAKARVTNEHCIGVLKSRWFSLKEIRTQLNLPKDSLHVVKWIGISAKLHNFVISMNDFWTETDGRMELESDLDIPSLDESCPVYGPQENGSLLLTRVMNHAINFNQALGGCLNPDS